MFTQYSGSQEWYLPSWKVEPKYSTKVLIGNWLEERKKFIRDPEKSWKSTHERDYVRFPTQAPDYTVMRKNRKKLDGLPKKYVLTLHNEDNHRYLVTQYDGSYNRHSYNPSLPPLRKWNKHKLAWTPERSDFPAAEPPSNYGLYEHLAKKWKHRDPAVMDSNYTLSYKKPPLSAYPVQQHPITTRLLNSSHEHLRPRTMDGYL